MRSRRTAPDEVADVARRRLELLSAELAGIRPGAPGPSSQDDRDGSGELPTWSDPPASAGPAAAVDDESQWSVRRPTVMPRDNAAGEAPRTSPAVRRDPSSEHAWDERAPGRHAHRSLGVRANALRWVEDRLPASLQGRTRLTGGHLAVVALTVAAGLALTVWWVARADGDVTTVTSVPSVAPSAAADPGGSGLSGSGSTGMGSTGMGSTGMGSTGMGSTGMGSTGMGSTGTGSLLPGAGGSPAAGVSAGASVAPAAGTGGSPASSGAGSVVGSIVVDVTGKVRRPGIATLPTGARVVDAIEAAGGAKRGARLGTLNLARVLSDGEQVVVGLPAPSGVAASAASAPTSGAPVPMVNVNTATASELEALPGIGPVTAAAILDYRTENGPFGSVDALLEVSGIGDATLAKIAPYVTL